MKINDNREDFDSSESEEGIAIEDVQQELDVAEVCEEDLEVVKNLGKGNFGVVALCKHKESGELFAVKKISSDVRDEKEKKHLVTELRTLYKASRSTNPASRFIIGFHVSNLAGIVSSYLVLLRVLQGAYFTSRHLNLVTEYMNAGTVFKFCALRWRMARYELIISVNRFASGHY